MKRIIVLLTAAALLLSLAACSGEASADQASSSEISGASSSDSSSVIDSALDQAKAPSSAEDNAAAPKSDGVDVDLTTMSSTMVYSEVLNMQQAPEKYMGKTVKMQGPFSVTEIDSNRYFACLIKDATACCSTGIEFELAGDYSYPDDYPAKDSEITVVGTFTTYMEGENKYLQLKDAKLI